MIPRSYLDLPHQNGLTAKVACSRECLPVQSSIRDVLKKCAVKIQGVILIVPTTHACGDLNVGTGWVPPKLHAVGHLGDINAVTFECDVPLQVFKNTSRPTANIITVLGNSSLSSN